MDRHAGAVARLDAARQRQGGAEAGLAGLHQLIGLLGVARPQRCETQPGVLRDDVENVDGVAARLAVRAAVGEREVVLDGGVVNHAVARHPILLHRRQVGIAGVEVAGDLLLQRLCRAFISSIGASAMAVSSVSISRESAAATKDRLPRFSLLSI